MNLQQRPPSVVCHNSRLIHRFGESSSINSQKHLVSSSKMKHAFRNYPPFHQIGRYFLRALLALSLVYYAALMLDLLLHPLAPGVGVSAFSVDEAAADRILEALIGTGVIVVGAFIIRRVPGNRVGPLLILYGVGTASYVTRVDYGPPLLTSLTHLIFVIYSGVVVFPALFVLLLSFPTGQLYPRRAARWVTIYVMLYVIGSTIGVMAQSPSIPSSFGGDGFPVNPFFVAALAPYYNLIIITT
jgi:hypothetical protein